MSMIEVKLNRSNSENLDQLARSTGRSPDELANKAVERFIQSESIDESAKFKEWRDALIGVEGIWAARDDLPDFDAIRGSWDRNIWK